MNCGEPLVRNTQQIVYYKTFGLHTSGLTNHAHITEKTVVLLLHGGIRTCVKHYAASYLTLALSRPSSRRLQIGVGQCTASKASM
jgi:hypothetical protein